MRTPTSSKTLRAVSVAAFAAGLSALASGCAGTEKDPNLVAGKQMFVKNCGSCHVLARAGTKGTTGPNLDEAFRQPLQEGFGRDAVRGVVADQIAYPNLNGVMPPKLGRGKDAEDVAPTSPPRPAQPARTRGCSPPPSRPPGATSRSRRRPAC